MDGEAQPTSRERKALEGRSERPAMGYGQPRTLSAFDFRGASAAGRQKFRRVRSSSVRRSLRLRVLPGMSWHVGRGCGGVIVR